MKIFRFVLLVVLCLLNQVASAALPISKIPLKSGATLYFVEAHSIPMLDIGVDFVGGDVYDPSGKSGVAGMTASLMNKGTLIDGKLKNEAYIADHISDLGASVSFGSSSESLSIRVRTLIQEDVLRDVVNLVSNMAAAPVFDGKILEREKQRWISSIKDANTKPEVLLSKNFDKLVFKNHPLGVDATVQSVAAINVNDLKKYHQTFFNAKRANVLIVGDVSQNQAMQIAEQLTQALPKDSGDLPTLPKLMDSQKLPASERELRIAHPSTQAHIRMGMTAVPRNHPDYFALLVGNYVLGGGGFVSRLMNEVREKRGLAYSVSSYFYPGKFNGSFVAGMQTKKEQTNEALEVMRTTISEFIQNGPSDAELKAAKDNLINGFPLRIDSNRKLLDNISNIAWHGLPLNLLDTWTDQVNAVTKDQIIRAFQNHLDMERMVTVVVGGQ